MLNEDPSEHRHPLESGESHPLSQSTPASASQPARRAHPLEQTTTEARSARQQFVVAFPMARPYVTYTLMVINCLIFFGGMLYPALRTSMVEFGVLYRPLVVEGGEYYRLFTSMFLHADITHLFFNMYSLYIIGRSIEWVFGWQRFLLIYLLSGLGGSVLFLLSLGANGSGLGASGAIFGIWGAEMVFLYRHRRELGAFAQSQLRSIVIIALLNLLIGFSNPRIGTWAHIGGFIAGVGLTWWLGPRLQTRQHPDHPSATVLTDRQFDSPLIPVVVYTIVLAAMLLIGLQLFG